MPVEGQQKGRHGQERSARPKNTFIIAMRQRLATHACREYSQGHVGLVKNVSAARAQIVQALTKRETADWQPSTVSVIFPVRCEATQPGRSAPAADNHRGLLAAVAFLPGDGHDVA